VNTPSSLEVLFWSLALTVAFAYGVYPFLIYFFSRLFGRRSVSPSLQEANLPRVSLLIAAHNEEVDIQSRIENCLALDYPRNKLEIVIASDGSTDRTNEIVRSFQGQGVKLFAFAKNRGKATVLNDVVPQLSGEIIVLSDANTFMAIDSVRCLVSWFSSERVGVVCGRLILADPVTGRNVDSLYWKYETFLKKCESRLGALLGSNGAIYAIRKSLFPFVQPGTLIDDFVIPLEAKRRSGCRIIYDLSAVAVEETPPTILAEFRRRVRIGAGGFQSICTLWPLLSPAHGWIAFTFFCHKILRWACPFLLIGMLITSVFLASSNTNVWALYMQTVFYALAFVGNAFPNKPKFLRLFRLPTMFATMNIALLFGFFRWLRGGQTGIWTRTRRTGDTPLEYEHPSQLVQGDG
jgi:cellulose synthase/poly-beta-1,6-N-acetylglucosamine synthase-like glycosyltransferase